jgi:hypothetical protein
MHLRGRGAEEEVFVGSDGAPPVLPPNQTAPPHHGLTSESADFAARQGCQL